MATTSKTPTRRDSDIDTDQGALLGLLFEMSTIERGTFEGQSLETQTCRVR